MDRRCAHCGDKRLHECWQVISHPSFTCLRGNLRTFFLELPEDFLSRTVCIYIHHVVVCSLLVPFNYKCLTMFSRSASPAWQGVKCYNISTLTSMKRPQVWPSWPCKMAGSTTFLWEMKQIDHGSRALVGGQWRKQKDFKVAKDRGYGWALAPLLLSSCTCSTTV